MLGLDILIAEFVSYFAGVFLLILQHSLSQEFHFFPQNQEIRFLWRAKIGAGSYLPVKLTSGWCLNATLVVQSTEEAVKLQVRRETPWLLEVGCGARW